MSQAEQEARTLALAIIDRAAPKEAGREELQAATAAVQIVQTAEKRASLVSRGDAEALLAEVTEWGEDFEEEIHELAEAGATQAEVEEAVRRTVAEGEARIEQIQRWLARQGDDVWVQAAQELREMGGFIERPN